jgi:hypothetical protein
MAQRTYSQSVNKKKREDGLLDSASPVYEPVLDSCEQSNELWIHKRQGISSLAEQLLAFQEVLWSMELEKKF